MSNGYGCITHDLIYFWGNKRQYGIKKRPASHIYLEKHRINTFFILIWSCILRRGKLRDENFSLFQFRSLITSCWLDKVNQREKGANFLLLPMFCPFQVTIDHDFVSRVQKEKTKRPQYLFITYNLNV